MTANLIYDGFLRTTLTHLQSGTIIETDAPTDNQGKGERFSPTDLLAVSLASCMITTMAIKTADLHFDLTNTRIEVTKIMSADQPRRISSVVLNFFFPKDFKASETQKEMLIRIARNCPVEKSLHPDIKIITSFNW